MMQKIFYFPDEFKVTIKKFEDIADREKPDRRGGASRLLRKMIEEYVQEHEPGNPQQKLDRFRHHGSRSYVAPRRCNAGGCPNKATDVLEWVSDVGDIKGNQHPFCAKHTEQKLQQKHLWKETGLSVAEVR